MNHETSEALFAAIDAALHRATLNGELPAGIDREGLLKDMRAASELRASWVKATAEADAWRSWAVQVHGSPLTSDDAARGHIDAGIRFVNNARSRLQRELSEAQALLAAGSPGQPDPETITKT